MILGLIWDQNDILTLMKSEKGAYKNVFTDLVVACILLMLQNHFFTQLSFFFALECPPSLST